MQFEIRESNCVHGKRRAGEITLLFLYDYAKYEKKKRFFKFLVKKLSPRVENGKIRK